MNKLCPIFFLFLLNLSESLKAEDDTPTDSTAPKRVYITGIALPSRSPENGFYIQGGAMTLFNSNKSDTKLSNVYLFGLYSEKKQFRISIGGDVFFLKQKLYVYNWSCMSYYPDEYYFPDSTNTLIPEFASSRFYHSEWNILYRFWSSLYFGLTVDYEKNKFSESDVSFQFTDTYFNYTLSGVGLISRLDRRDQVFWPSSGFLLEAYYKPLWRNGSSGTMHLAKVDFRSFSKPFTTIDNTLAFQILFELASENMVFSYIPNAMGRAFHPNQFRYKSFLNSLADYQIKAWRFVYPAVFTEFSVSGNSNYPFQISTGGGLRLKLSKSKRIFLRIDYAVGNYSVSNLHISFYNAI